MNIESRKSLRIVIVALVGIGVLSSLNRAYGVKHGALFFNPILPMLTPEELQNLHQFDTAFVAHSHLTYLHIFGGSLFLILAPLQFSRNIRMNHIVFHRWSGRMLLLLGVLTGFSGLILSKHFLFAGILGISAVVLAGLVFLTSLVAAFRSILKKDIVRHQRWMTRAFSIGIGISIVRIVSGLILWMTGRPTFEMLALSFWIGWALSFAIGELWIRSNQNQKVAAEIR